MKKLLYSFAILIALTGCSSDDPAPQQEEEVGEETIAASNFTLESPAGATFAWQDGSKISLFRSNTNEKFEYRAESSDFVKADKLKKGEAFDNIYGVYPYKGTSRVNNGEIKTSIPSEQTYSAAGINFEENPMVGVSASADSPAMEFKSLCGFAVVKLYGTAEVKSVGIQGNNGEVLAGTAIAEIGADGEPTFEITALPSASTMVASEEAVALGLTEVLTFCWKDITPAYEVRCPPAPSSGGSSGSSARILATARLLSWTNWLLMFPAVPTD